MILAYRIGGLNGLDLQGQYICDKLREPNEFSDGSRVLPESWVSGLGSSAMEKWFLTSKLNKAFLHFLPHFWGIFNDFSKWSALKVL